MPDWITAILWLVLAIAAVVIGIRWSRSRGWSARHRAALAVGALLTYVWVGFTQASDMGVPLATALTGNVIFSTAALVLAAATLRSVRRTNPGRTVLQEQQEPGHSATG